MAIETPKVPQHIRPQGLHEILALDIPEDLIRPYNSRIRKHNIQAPIFRHRFIYNGLHSRFVRGVELPSVDVHLWVQGLKFPFVHGKIFIAEVANIDGAGTIVGELVGAGAADAERGVGACYDDYLVLDPSGVFVNIKEQLALQGKMNRRDSLPGGVWGDLADLGNVLKGAWVGRGNLELLAKLQQSLLGC